MSYEIEDKNDKIHEVYDDNFVFEMRKVSKLIERYNYVSMDTEFPGFVYQSGSPFSKTESSNYVKLKSNVDCLKLIQVGLSLSDKNGNVPPGGSTWQFNFNFDVK